jgi:phosphatidate cytidylyltransferase
MKRILTAAALIPLVVYVVLWANWWTFLAVVALCACLTYREYNQIAAGYGFGAPGPAGYLLGLALLGPSWWVDTWPLLGVCAVLALTLALRSADLAHILPRASLLLLGIVYVFACWHCAIPLHDRNPHLLMYALLVSWAGDAGAYYVGSTLGKHRLAERVSPKKSWEGAAASVLAAILFAGGYLVYVAHAATIAEAVTITAVANIAGQIGDLAESAMKRGAGVKDSGAILPGHGGFLDRVDSTLFVLPVVYACMRFLH